MKTNKIAVISFVLIAVLLLAAAGLLFQGIRQFRDVSGQLNISRRMLSNLYQRDPFPSESNIVSEQQHLETLHAELDAMMQDLADGQVEPVQTAPLRFVEMFRDTSRRLAAAAEARGIIVPADAAFGFQRHRAGDLPNPSDVPRLIQQLEIVDQLVNTLYEVGITELKSVGRQEFEVRAAPVAGPAPGAGGGLFGGGTPQPPVARDVAATEPPYKVGILEDNADFASLRFTLEVTARESEFRDLMNRLAAHSMFIIVTHVEMNNRFVWTPMRTAPAGGERAAEQQSPANLARNARVATDGMQKPFQVRIELEVYRFRKDTAS